MTALADNTTEAVIDGQTRTVTSEAGLPVVNTPPDVTASFDAATQVGEPGESAATGQTEPEGTPILVADTETPLIEENPNPPSNIELGGGGGEEYSGPMHGYFTAMLNDRECCGPAWLDNVYVSDARQDFDSGTVKAAGLYDPSNAFVRAGTGSGLVYLEEVNVDLYAQSGPLGPGWPVTYQQMGQSEYMGWGYWYVQNDFIVNNYTHDLHHKGYYVFGDPTPDPAVTGISGWYAGPAYGTFWAPNVANPAQAPQGIDMQGGFECFVNGPAMQVTDFNLVVMSADQQYAAAIETPTGEISGTFNSSSFSINDPGENMSWLLVLPGTPYPTVLQVNSYKDANGSLYGPNGAQMGGVWGMKEFTGTYPNEQYVGAQGIFHGDNVGSLPPSSP